MDTTHWAPWPGTLADWVREQPDDPDYPGDFSATNTYFQLATRPLFELWDNEPLTEEVQASASPEQIGLFAVYAADADITNGGFWQWLQNSYSCLYPELLAGHRMLGLSAIADLIEDAVDQVFPTTQLPLDHQTRLAALDVVMQAPNIDQVMAQLDLRERTYYQPDPDQGYTDNDELLPLMCRWIDQHPHRFFTEVPANLGRHD